MKFQQKIIKTIDESEKKFDALLTSRTTENGMAFRGKKQILLNFKLEK